MSDKLNKEEHAAFRTEKRGKVPQMMAEARTKIKALLAREEAVLSEELAELLTLRELT